jgi:hypothetical protein
MADFKITQKQFEKLSGEVEFLKGENKSLRKLLETKPEKKEEPKEEVKKEEPKEEKKSGGGMFGWIDDIFKS